MEERVSSTPDFFSFASGTEHIGVETNLVFFFHCVLVYMYVQCVCVCVCVYVYVYILD